MDGIVLDGRECRIVETGLPILPNGGKDNIAHGIRLQEGLKSFQNGMRLRMGETGVEDFILARPLNDHIPGVQLKEIVACRDVVDERGHQCTAARVGIR